MTVATQTVHGCDLDTCHHSGVGGYVLQSPLYLGEESRDPSSQFFPLP